MSILERIFVPSQDENLRRRDIPDIVLDIERLIPLYDLFGEVLDQLCRIGTASDYDPGVVL